MSEFEDKVKAAAEKAVLKLILVVLYEMAEWCAREAVRGSAGPTKGAVSEETKALIDVTVAWLRSDHLCPPPDHMHTLPGYVDWLTDPDPRPARNEEWAAMLEGLSRE